MINSKYSHIPGLAITSNLLPTCKGGPATCTEGKRYANIKIDQGVVVGKKIKPTGNKYRDLGSPRLQLPPLLDTPT